MKDKNGMEHSEKNGQFVSKGNTDTAAEQKRAEELTEENPENSAEDISSLLGQEYIGFKGQDAVDKLIQEKQGHIKGAFHREDIGDIDLIWGDDDFGLKHIIKRREEEGIDTNTFIKSLVDVTEKGDFVKKNKRGNFEFWYDKKMVVVSPELRNNKLTFVLTAFKKDIKK